MARAARTPPVTVGIDLGGTKIQSGALVNGAVIPGARILTPHSGVDDVVAGITATVTAAAEAAGVAVTALAGVGVGSPGHIDAQQGTVSRSPNVPGFDDPVPLASLLSAALGGVPVTLENDVRVAMIGEHRLGAGRPYRNVMGVFLGTGVGGGLVLDGTLRTGRGSAGEIGHTTVDPEGPMCSDGRPGHLEAYAGRGCIEAHAHRLEAEGHRTTLFDIQRQKGKDHLSSSVIHKAVAGKDKVATHLMEKATWAMAIALANTQNLLDLEAFIIGGGLGDRLGQPFVDDVVAQMMPRLLVPDHAPTVLTTELGDLSGATGAALLASDVFAG
jgi:glucokinase